MQDPLLTVFLADVERDEWPGLSIWVATPAGVFVGEVISTHRFYLESETALKALTQAEQAQETHTTLAEAGFPVESKASTVPKYLYLAGTRLLSAGGRGALLGLARIDLEQIHGWAFYVPDVE